MSNSWENEPRDWHGRWTGGGTSSYDRAKERAPEDILYPSMRKMSPIPPQMTPIPPNAPGRPLMSPISHEEILAMKDKEGWVSAGPDKGSHECVALPKAAVPGMGRAADLRKLDDISGPDDPKLKPNMVIGYGFDANGNYPNNASGNHLAVVVGPYTDKYGHRQLRILDQSRSMRADYRNANWSNKWSTVTRRR